MKLRIQFVVHDGLYGGRSGDDYGLSGSLEGVLGVFLRFLTRIAVAIGAAGLNWERVSDGINTREGKYL